MDSASSAFGSGNIQQRTCVSVSISNISSETCCSAATQRPCSSGSIQQHFGSSNTSAAAALQFYLRVRSISVQRPQLLMFRQQQHFSATSATIGFNDSATARQRCATAVQRQHLLRHLRHLQHQQFLQHLDQQCCFILQLLVATPRDRAAPCGRGAEL